MTYLKYSLKKFINLKYSAICFFETGIFLSFVSYRAVLFNDICLLLEVVNVHNTYGLLPSVLCVSFSTELGLGIKFNSIQYSIQFTCDPPCLHSISIGIY